MGAPWTPGPWRWEVNLKGRTVQLCGGLRPKYDLTVMGFARWGMGSAAPRFIDARNIMHRCETMAVTVPGREHHADWFRTIDHPDARLIAAAPDLAEALEPFVAFFEVYLTLGAPTPKKGLVYSIASRAGERDLTTEHFEAARAALSKARGETP